MSNKKLFNKIFTKLLIPITKRIESFFNFFKNWNYNKKRYLNLWSDKSLKKKILIASAAIFIAVITYFLMPAFYDQNIIKAQLENHILQKYNLDVKLDKNPQYGLFPKPYFLAENVKIQHNSRDISFTKNIKFFISSKNNFEFNKIKLKNIVFNETDFKIKKINLNFFLDLLNNEVANQNIKFNKSKLFYLDQNDNVIFFTNLKKLNYFYQENLLNKMESNLEIFNLPVNLKTKHNIVNKNIFTEIYINLLKLKIENNLNYNEKEFNGELDFNLINKDESVSYSLRNGNLIFITKDKKLSGEINTKPFFLSANLDLQGANIKEVYKNDSIIVNLLKSEIFNNTNLNGKISVTVDNLNDLKNIEVIKFDIQFEEGLIFISNLNFLYKNFVIFNFNDASLVVDNNQLKFIGDIVIDFKNIENFYSHFQIKRSYRRNIDQINSSFIFNLDDKIFELNELKIKGVNINKQILDKYLNDFNSKEKDFFNNVTIRNTVRNFFKIISSD